MSDPLPELVQLIDVVFHLLHDLFLVLLDGSDRLFDNEGLLDLVDVQDVSLDLGTIHVFHVLHQLFEQVLKFDRLL